MDLMDKASNGFYDSYNKAKRARTAIAAAMELLQMNDKSKWDAAADNLRVGQELLNSAKKMDQKANKEYNTALQKSPDVDPNCKAWSAVMSMKSRARDIAQNADSDIRKLKRKEPKAFLQIQSSVSSGFKKVAEKKVVLEDKDEDSMVDFVKNYVGM